MGIQPLADRIVVRRHSAEATTAGGILLPDTAQNKPQRGVILAVGPGKMSDDGSRQAPSLKVGDEVLFTSWAGDAHEERADRSEVLIMREGEVLAVIES